MLGDDGMALDLYQLKAFWVFAKIRNFSKTADRLYVTQSAISHAMKKLEQSVGTPLIVRRGGAYRLTEAGEALYGSCERVFHEIDRFEAELQYGGRPLRQKLHLGAPVEFGTTVLVRHLAEFSRRFPNIHLNCQFSHHLHPPLLRDELDLIIDCRPYHHSGIERIFLFRERYVVIATPEFVEKNNIRKISDLERVMILSMDESGEWWNNFIFAQPKEHRTVLKNIIQINHVRGLINGALAGMGVSFVPRYTVENELRESRLCDVFPGGQLMDDHFCMYVKREKREFPKNRLMIDFLLERFSGFDEAR
jgi:DNA-binding transcriptional LysR family regulator